MNKQKYEHILDVSRQARSFSLLCWYSNYVHVAQGGISFYLLYPSIVIILIPRPHKSIKGNVMTYHIQRHTILVKLFNAYCTSYIIHSIFPEYIGTIFILRRFSTNNWYFELFLLYLLLVMDYLPWLFWKKVS